MNTTTISEKISTSFQKLVNADAKIHNAHLLVHSKKDELHLNLAGSHPATNPENAARIGQPVFMASVGKLFTAVLVAKLVEQGKLSFNNQIADFLESDLLAGLHVFKGKDYSREIRLKHLLNHTSGLPDFFEDKPFEGTGMIERILSEPDHRYTPHEIITWSKKNMNPLFPPGEGFHYSDTGYHLLGLTIEAVTAMPFHAALNHYIFEPVGMKHAFVLQHSQPLEEYSTPVAGVFFGETNVIDYRSLSIDYAGGGVTAPLEDLLSFMRVFVQGNLLAAETLKSMRDSARFSIGIDYGYGMMIFRTVPILMPARYNSWGNAGSTGSFMFYHPGQDAYLIGSLNQFRYHSKGIRFMLRVIDTIIKKNR